MTLTVLGVAGWTVRFAADQLLQHAGSVAADAATSRVELLMRRVRTVTPDESPLDSASEQAFREASRHLHDRLTDELDVGLLRRGRPDAQWCAAFRRAVADDAAIAAFLAEVDPARVRGDTTEDQVVERSFHLGYLRWLRTLELGDEPPIVESWLLDGIPDPSGARRSLLYERYLGHFDRCYRTDAEVRAALDTVRFQALMGAVDAVPLRTAEAIATQTAARARGELAVALEAHLRITAGNSAHFRLPLHDADGHEVRVGIDELYLDLPLELPPGTEAPPTAESEPPRSYVQQVASTRREGAPSTSSTGEGPAAQAPPSLSVAACLDHRPRLLLTGGPGSGKSSIVRFLAWHYAHRALDEATGAGAQAGAGHTGDPKGAGAAQLAARLPERPWIPVVVRCKDLSTAELGAPLRELVAAQLVRDGEVAVDRVQPLAQELVDRLRRGEALLLLDGLDEVDAGSRARLAEIIERTVELHPRTAVVVTSRHTGLTEVLGRLSPVLDHYEIAALRTEHQEQFLDGWSALATRLGGDAPADELRRVVTGTRDLARLGEFIQPLTLIAQVHLRDGSIPPNRAKLYRRAVGELLRSRGEPRHIDEVWPEMTHLAYRMHESGAVVWEMDDAEAAVDQFLELARRDGLERRLRRPLPETGAHWLADAVQLAILNQSGRTETVDELLDDYGDEEHDEYDAYDAYDDEPPGGAGPGLAARLEFCHLAFQEFCAAHALLSPHRVIARD